jgi:hypothetical protein
VQPRLNAKQQSGCGKAYKRCQSPSRKITPSLRIYNIVLAADAGDCVPSH